MLSDSFDFFSLDQFRYVAGVDEVGRGCLAGPVVAAAVILNPDAPIEGLRDSKKLSAHRREELVLEIKEKALAWAVCAVSPKVIDEINILQATMRAMKEAVGALTINPNFVRVDGNRLPRWHWLSEAIVKGDDKVPEISAASIIAKTTRDAYMLKMADVYPHYGFEHNVGYGTADHIEGLNAFGVTPIHRKTFAPVKDMLHAVPND